MNGFFILAAYFVSSDILEYDKIQLTYLNGVSITLFLAKKKKKSIDYSITLWNEPDCCGDFPNLIFLYIICLLDQSSLVEYMS